VKSFAHAGAMGRKRLNPPVLSLIVPCHNGEPVIVASLTALGAYLDDWRVTHGEFELILVDDGSTDATAEIVRERFPWVRLISLRKNLGKGGAVRAGMLEARGAVRVFTDADLPFDVGAIGGIAECLLAQEFDLCVGTRREGDVWPAAQRTFLRRLSSDVFARLVGISVLGGNRDTQCGLKGFRAEAAEYLFRVGGIDGFAFDVEIMYLAIVNGMKIKHYPVTTLREEYSTVSVWKHGPGMARDALMVPVKYRLGRYPRFEGKKEE
jgi:dolichyl-phosphate beta-glucosyltransferase